MDHDLRKDFAFLSLAGQNVSVFTSDGAVWEGIFVATDAKASDAVLLSCAVRAPSKDHSGSEPAVWFDKCYIPMESIMMINAVDVKMQTGNTASEKVVSTKPAPLPENPTNMKWDEDVSLDNFEAEEKNWKQGKSWDQFAENERKFGVKSTYNEELYTTKMGKFTPAQMAEADRKARDIETSVATGGIQQRIERGEDVDMDEGEMYSDVKRTDNRSAPKKADVAPLPSGKTGSYVPPAKRAAGGPQIVPQQPVATVPPQAVTVNAPPPPKGGNPATPQQQVSSPTMASNSETPKAEVKLNAAAKAWVPAFGGAAVAAPAVQAPVMDFAAAFNLLATSTLMDAMTYHHDSFQSPNMAAPEWFVNNNEFQGNAGGFNSNQYQAPQQQGGYSSGGGYNGGNGGNGGGGYASNNQYASHQGHQGGYNNNNFGGPNQQNPNYNAPPQQFTNYPATRGRGGGVGGRGGMGGQPQQPLPNSFRGGMGGPGHNTHMAPQPLDSGSEMPVVNRGGPAPVSQIDPAPDTSKPAAKNMLKRGR